MLLNEARSLGGAQGQLITEQARAMQSQLEHYLQRARIAAQRDSVVFRTPVTPLLQRMVRVMEKLGERVRIVFTPPAAEIVFAGEREDFEEIVGNLMENAVKWARSSVQLSVSTLPAVAGESRFALVIEDDGPGIPEDKAREALRRAGGWTKPSPGPARASPLSRNSSPSMAAPSRSSAGRRAGSR